MTERAVTAGRADPGDVAVALHLLTRMNLTLTDLVDGAPAREVPTFAELVPKVVEAMPAPSRRIYGPYWDKVLAAWGPRRLTEPEDGEVTRFLEHVRETAVVRRSSNGGHGAALHAYYALGAVFRYAVNHELIGVRQNVMDRVSKPDKADSKRHGLSPQLVAEILTAARSTGNDRALDALILRFHLETACRTGGALALRRRDLDVDQCLVRLREKGSMQRWQPISPTLMEYLDHHAHERGARDEDSRVLRFSNGDPLTKKRYETLWNRVGKHVESVRVLGISAHWLRHTTLTWVERNFGYAVSQAYAGHAAPKSNQHGVTRVYVKAGIGEVATAVQALTRERHPLALAPSAVIAEDDPSPMSGLAE
ncbi:tyrosine-type recombinase/integrase [Actinosynnema sp. NPDC059797]